MGEIDLIMRDKECLVFVEVRYRSSTAFVAPALTVDARKQRKIAQTAAFFLARNSWLGDIPVRFDVVAAEGTAGGSVRIQWIKDAFRV
jgi:putative endonuclease